MNFLLSVLLCVFSVLAQESNFEEIVPDPLIGEPDALAPTSEGSSDIGEPDALGENEVQPPVGGDVQLDLNFDDPPADPPISTDVPKTDLSLPNESVESQSLSLPSAPSRAPSPPNYDKEKFFSRIYRQFNRKPISSEIWNKLSIERKGEVYAVQKGDNLWDISRTFFGEGEYWPKVWSLNKSITNPHKIEPQHELVFYPGNLDEEPRLEVGAESQEAKPETEVVEQKVLPNGVNIPPPRSKPKKLINIPRSLPFLRTFVLEKPDYSAPTIGYPIERSSSNQLEVTTYFDNQLPAGIGEIVEIETSGKVANQFQYVHVKFASVPADGELLAIGVVDSFKMEGRPQGHILEIQGTLKLANAVNSGQSIYRMLVTRAIHPVQVGAKVVAGNINKMSALPTGSAKAVSGQVFGGRFETARSLYGTGGVVFLNAGSNQGVAVGDMVSIVANPKVRNAASVVVENFKKIAEVKVIYVTGTTATAYVVSASEAIRTGDYSGLPGALGLGGATIEEDGFAEEGSGENEGFEDIGDEFAGENEDVEFSGDEGFADDFGNEEGDDFGGESEDSDFGGDDPFAEDSDEDFQEF